MFNQGYYSRKNKASSFESHHIDLNFQLRPSGKVKLNPLSLNQFTANNKISLEGYSSPKSRNKMLSISTVKKDRQKEYEIELCKYLGINLQSRESEHEENQSPLIKIQIKTPQMFINKSSNYNNERAKSQINIEKQEISLKRAKKLSQFEPFGDQSKIRVKHRHRSIFMSDKEYSDV